MIRTVVFDIGNVLMDFDWMPYMRSMFDDAETIDKINQAIWGSGCWQAMDKGEMGIHEALGIILASVPSHEREIRKALQHVGDSMHKHDYAIPWIQEIKAMGYRVLYLSNYSEFAMSANPGVLDFLPQMDGGIFSCHVKKIKPDHEIYHLLCATYHLDPEECLFVDDMLPNVQAAQECGWQAVQFEGYAKSYPKIMALIAHGRNH